jgi:hypothetical protein
MDGNELISLARQLYIDQLVGFLRSQFAKYPGGAAEVPTERPTNPNLYGAHYRIDFVTSVKGEMDASLVVELEPDQQLEFDPIEGTAGATEVRMEKLNWDDVEIVHDIPGDMAPRLKDWFEQWYDPDERRITKDAKRPPDVIHSLGIYPTSLVIDFGTASTDAFWSLIAILRDAGAKKLLVRDTRKLPRERAN